MEETTERSSPKWKFPVAIYFLFVELLVRSFGRFCLRSVRNLYLRNKLHFSTDDTISINHGVELTEDWFMPLGALVASGLTNRFNILLIGTVLTIVARIIIFIGSLPKLRFLIFLYLFWFFDGIPIIIMSGVLNSLGGDQFKVPEENRAINNFYSVSYVLHNISVLSAFYLAPLLKTEVACFGEQDCYPLAFGLSAVCTLIEIVLLAAGSKFFVKKKPARGILLKFFMCIGNGIKMWIRERKTNPRPHWLDHAEPAYGAQLVSDIKRFFQILVMLLPFPIFYAVYVQMDSKWLFQATRMDGRVGSYTIIPDHYQLLNPFLVLFLVPLITKVIDPMTKRFGMERVLRRLVVGGFLISLSFVISGFLESKMKQNYPVLPNNDQCEVRIFNGANCSLNIMAAGLIKDNIEVYSLSMYTKKHIAIDKRKEITISGKGSCATLNEEIINIEGGVAKTIFIQNNEGEGKIIDYVETIDKSETGFPIISVIGVDSTEHLILEDSKGVQIEMKSADRNKPAQEEVVPETYKLTLNGKVILAKFKMHLGGVYVIMVAGGSSNIYEIVEPNNVHILWICIQQLFLTAGEVYFAVAILNFLYTEAPESLVQVVMSLDIFVEGLGNGLVIILTVFRTLDQDHEFYLSALIMAIDVFFLIFLALRYKPVDPNSKLI